MKKLVIGLFILISIISLYNFFHVLRCTHLPKLEPVERPMWHPNVEMVLEETGLSVSTYESVREATPEDHGYELVERLDILEINEDKQIFVTEDFKRRTTENNHE